MWWNGDIYVYRSDCGVNNSAGCDEAWSKGLGVAGCLWAVCKNGNNAIWDSRTLRCGCDDGKSSTFTPASAQEKIEAEADKRHQYVDPRCSPGSKDWGSSVAPVRSDLENTYGRYGNAAAEIEPNLVKMNFQGKEMTVHKYAAQALAEMDKEIMATHPGEYAINDTGSYFHRTKKTRQGDKQDEPSEHAYGIAFDINAGDMPVDTVTPRTNTVPSWFVDIAQKHGFKWGGNFGKNYYDPMHFQYTGGKAYWDQNGGKLPSWLSYKDSSGGGNTGTGAPVETTPLSDNKVASDIPNCRSDQDIKFNEDTNKCECVNSDRFVQGNDYGDGPNSASNVQVDNKNISPTMQAFADQGDSLTKDNTEVLVDKSDKKMYIYKDGKEIATANINIGWKDTAAQQDGGREYDAITPTGTFNLDGSDGARRHSLSGVYTSKGEYMGTSYIQTTATDTVTGKVRGIAFHGGNLDPGGTLHVTAGCIRLTNADADLFYKYSQPGMKVTIRN
jgi:lipoprotein-anchoring transpeptidase ErfK/SrfK